MKRLFLIAALILLPVLAAAQEPTRPWQSKSTQKVIKAVWDINNDSDEEHVFLIKNGKRFKVPIKNLSTSDQEYIENKRMERDFGTVDKDDASIKKPNSPAKQNAPSGQKNITPNTPPDVIPESQMPFFGWRRQGKARAIEANGGTEESEKAVALGLKWLAEHQLKDGSWNYNHQLAPSCGGKCNNSGSLDKTVCGATAMGLLPFLGAGIAHRGTLDTTSKKYSKNVQGGLVYLVSHGKVSRDGCVSYCETGGSIYPHGIATICLCEAFAMTKDKRLLPAAQGSLKYISYHQDPAGGGWRYSPHQAGDTSVCGWQLTALKTGYMAGLTVPNDTINKATRFLDSVQTDSGARYGYTSPGEGPSTTSVGLLSRMYLGWKHDNPALKRGVEWLSERGSSKTDYYYNYYATQVMFHYRGPLWEKWNASMRDQLVTTQYSEGHEVGSWYHEGPWSSRGGRLYDTALSLLILETYYRHPHIYQKSEE